MAWALSAMVLPAIHYNKKCPETIGTFFVSIAIGARLVMSFVKKSISKENESAYIPLLWGGARRAGWFSSKKNLKPPLANPQFCQEIALYLFVENILQK